MGNMADIKTIENEAAPNPIWAKLDAADRSAEALRQYPVMDETEHQSTVLEVFGIVDSFFPVKKGIYINHRVNRGKPFTVVKVEQPRFPSMSFARKQVEFRQPLDALGVEILFSKNTNSYLFRIYV
jgi:hypothetical protein